MPYANATIIIHQSVILTAEHQNTVPRISANRSGQRNRPNVTTLTNIRIGAGIKISKNHLKMSNGTLFLNSRGYVSVGQSILRSR